jgi:two-component system, OmpR family, sensor histidine kinase CpxA
VYSLFGKIFLSFWLTMIAVGVVIAWTTAQLGGEKIPPMIERAQNQFAEDAARAHQVLAARGISGLRAWLDNPDHTRAMRIYVFDASGREVLGQAVPGFLQRFARMSPDEDMDPEGSRERRRLIVHAVPVPGEGFYRLVMLFRPPHPVWHLYSVQGLLAALLLSGLVCFGLARYLSAPVRRLRTATQGLAGGDLGIRVGAVFGRRRDEMGELGRDFDRMADRLQSLIESQQRLLRDVSHELRSPLARLQAALGLARQRADGRASEELDRIEREAERLNELIAQVLSLARLDSGAGFGGSAREPLDLVALVDAVAGDAGFEAGQRDRRVAVSHGAPLMVSGNAELLHSAIENVVRNAVHYTERGTAVEISLAADEATGQAVITVRDHGPGVDASMLAKIFDPFFRASEARDRASGGHGLGLAIARRAVELHRGSITASNAEGGGLEVTIRLPMTKE